MTVVPYLRTVGSDAHAGHAAGLLVHVLAGILLLPTGAAALYFGWTGRWRRFHRPLAHTYPASGTVCTLSALSMSIRMPHEPRSLYVATATLTVVWLAVAAVALRASRNRRFDQHRDWVIRRSVLSWTFVGCRLAGTFNLFPMLGDEAVSAQIWANWVLPMVACEVILQWRRTAALPAQDPPR